MRKGLAVPVACLVLCGAAAAQDMPGLATLSPPDRARAVSALEPERPPEAAPKAAPLSRDPDGGRADPGSAALRGTDPGPARVVAALKVPSGEPRPWCTQERRVGTGTGFCLIN